MKWGPIELSNNEMQVRVDSEIYGFIMQKEACNAV